MTFFLTPFSLKCSPGKMMPLEFLVLLYHRQLQIPYVILVGIIGQNFDEKNLSFLLLRIIRKWQLQNQRLTLEKNSSAIINFWDLVFRWIFQNKLRTNSCLTIWRKERQLKVFQIHFHNHTTWWTRKSYRGDFFLFIVTKAWFFCGD